MNLFKAAEITLCIFLFSIVMVKVVDMWIGFFGRAVGGYLILFIAITLLIWGSM